MRLGVTRAADQLGQLRALADKQGVEIVPIPVTESVAVDFDWPDGLAVESIDWLVFTSRNGVDAFFQRLQAIGLRIDSHTRLAAVGQRTAEGLLQYVNSVDFQPSQAYGHALFKELLTSLPERAGVVVYPRARQISFDPAELFSESQVPYYAIVCYETTPRKVDPTLVRKLSKDDWILFTAPSAIDAYRAQFGQPVARPIAIGRTTAACMDELGWSDFITMEHPEINRVLEYLPCD
ncbi:MAG: uroporphyrinogen-III synthase [candidate division Zixibacteria bacterium]|nr:uroporphyrinogen-III synthase [candidate division Zixibacteria bacterium]